MKQYGYARISTPKQNINRQISNIKAAYPDAIILEEVYTGTKIERKEFNKLLKKVNPGDVIIFDEVSRMSRNAEDGFKLYKNLFERNIELVFLKEPHISTGTYKKALANNISMTGTNVDYILQGINKYLLALAEEQIKLAFIQSEKEVSYLRKRTSEGIYNAKLNGKQIGAIKGKKLTTKKSIHAKKEIIEKSKTFYGTISDKDLIKITGLARNTFYKYKNEIKKEIRDSFDMTEKKMLEDLENSYPTENLRNRQLLS